MSYPYPAVAKVSHNWTGRRCEIRPCRRACVDCSLRPSFCFTRDAGPPIVQCVPVRGGQVHHLPARPIHHARAAGKVARCVALHLARSQCAGQSTLRQIGAPIEVRQAMAIATAGPASGEQWQAIRCVPLIKWSSPATASEPTWTVSLVAGRPPIAYTTPLHRSSERPHQSPSTAVRERSNKPPATRLPAMTIAIATVTASASTRATGYRPSNATPDNRPMPVGGYVGHRDRAVAHAESSRGRRRIAPSRMGCQPLPDWFISRTAQAIVVNENAISTATITPEASAISGKTGRLLRFTASL
jgi:hypothetical protein